MKQGSRQEVLKLTTSWGYWSSGIWL